MPIVRSSYICRRYIPTLRSPVSGSRVTTPGSVMKRPPSNGQHFWMGRFKRVGQACGWPTDGGDRELGGLEGGPSQGQALAAGTGSKLCTTSLHGPCLT